MQTTWDQSKVVRVVAVL